MSTSRAQSSSRTREHARCISGFLSCFFNRAKRHLDARVLSQLDWVLPRVEISVSQMYAPSSLCLSSGIWARRQISSYKLINVSSSFTYFITAFYWHTFNSVFGTNCHDTPYGLLKVSRETLTSAWISSLAVSWRPSSQAERFWSFSKTCIFLPYLSSFISLQTASVISSLRSYWYLSFNYSCFSSLSSLVAAQSSNFESIMLQSWIISISVPISKKCDASFSSYSASSLPISITIGMEFFRFSLSALFSAKF